MAGDASTVYSYWCVNQALSLCLSASKQCLLRPGHDTLWTSSPLLLQSTDSFCILCLVYTRLSYTILGLFVCDCRRHILLHGDLGQATCEVVGPPASIDVGSFGLSLSLHCFTREWQACACQGDWEENLFFLHSKMTWSGYRALWLLYFYGMEEKARRLGSGERRWMQFLNQHSLSKPLEHGLAFDLKASVYQFKINSTGFPLPLSLQCSAPSRSISAVLEVDLG